MSKINSNQVGGYDIKNILETVRELPLREIFNSITKESIQVMSSYTNIPVNELENVTFDDISFIFNQTNYNQNYNEFFAKPLNTSNVNTSTGIFKKIYKTQNGGVYYSNNNMPTARRELQKRRLKRMTDTELANVASIEYHVSFIILSAYIGLCAIFGNNNNKRITPAVRVMTVLLLWTLHIYLYNIKSPFVFIPPILLLILCEYLNIKFSSHIII